jgi:hypothetical protein
VCRTLRHRRVRPGSNGVNTKPSLSTTQRRTAERFNERHNHSRDGKSRASCLSGTAFRCVSAQIRCEGIQSYTSNSSIYSLPNDQATSARMSFDKPESSYKKPSNESKVIVRRARGSAGASYSGPVLVAPTRSVPALPLRGRRDRRPRGHGDHPRAPGLPIRSNDHVVGIHQGRNPAAGDSRPPGYGRTNSVWTWWPPRCPGADPDNHAPFGGASAPRCGSGGKARGAFGPTTGRGTPTAALLDIATRSARPSPPCGHYWWSASGRYAGASNDQAGDVADGVKLRDVPN